MPKVVSLKANVPALRSADFEKNASALGRARPAHEDVSGAIEDHLAADPAEERRLFYVGLTRASRQVFLSRARERTLWGRRRRTEFSPWVQAMPAEVLERPALTVPQTRKGRQPRLFPEMASPRGKRSR